MQTQKEEIRKRIVLVARDEFMKNGVKHTSMMTIAMKAGIAVGNIYNYYKSKDDLLKAVLSPLLKAVKAYQMKNLDVTYASLDIYRYEIYYEIMKNQVASLVIPYRQEFRLLFFETAGSSLENYFDQLQEENCREGLTYIARLKERYPSINSDISNHFVGILCDLWAGLIKRIVMADDIDNEELERIISNYVRFGIGGWKRLLGVKFSDQDE